MKHSTLQQKNNKKRKVNIMRAYKQTAATRTRKRINDAIYRLRKAGYNIDKDMAASIRKGIPATSTKTYTSIQYYILKTHKITKTTDEGEVSGRKSFAESRKALAHKKATRKAVNQLARERAAAKQLPYESQLKNAQRLIDEGYYDIKKLEEKSNDPKIRKQIKEKLKENDEIALDTYFNAVERLSEQVLDTFVNDIGRDYKDKPWIGQHFEDKAKETYDKVMDFLKNLSEETKKGVGYYLTTTEGQDDWKDINNQIFKIVYASDQSDVLEFDEHEASKLFDLLKQFLDVVTKYMKGHSSEADLQKARDLYLVIKETDDLEDMYRDSYDFF